MFNNVHPRLGGLHTIMNSSGSVGNLWWCRNNAIPDLIKHCNTKLLLPPHEVLFQCWQEGAVPQDIRDSNIITIYKKSIYPESHSGFRAERSTIDMIFSLRQLQEKCREHQQRRPLLGSPKYRLPTQTAECDRVFPY